MRVLQTEGRREIGSGMPLADPAGTPIASMSFTVTGRFRTEWSFAPAFAWLGGQLGGQMLEAKWRRVA
jgi:hypothetical protein